MGKEILELCAHPSFLEGVARLFDIGGTLDHYNYSRSEEEADYSAILSDWRHVGNDIRKATDQFARIYLEGMDGQTR